MKGTNQCLVQRRMAWRPDTRQQRCCQIAGHRLKEKESLFLFVKRLPFFFTHASSLFSRQGPLGVSANLSFFFLFFFQFNLNLFFYLFIRSLQAIIPWVLTLKFFRARFRLAWSQLRTLGHFLYTRKGIPLGPGVDLFQLLLTLRLISSRVGGFISNLTLRTAG